MTARYDSSTCSSQTLSLFKITRTRRGCRYRRGCEASLVEPSGLCGRHKMALTLNATKRTQRVCVARQTSVAVCTSNCVLFFFCTVGAASTQRARCGLVGHLWTHNVLSPFPRLVSLFGLLNLDGWCSLTLLDAVHLLQSADRPLVELRPSELRCESCTLQQQEQPESCVDFSHPDTA